MPTIEPVIVPAAQLPDIRRSAGYLLKLLRQGVKPADLADACDWVDRSFEHDPIARVHLDLLEPDSLIVVKPAEKIGMEDAERLCASLKSAMGDRFVGVVFPDPDTTIEHLSDAELEKLRMVRMSEGVFTAWSKLTHAAIVRAADAKTTKAFHDECLAFGTSMLDMLADVGAATRENRESE